MPRLLLTLAALTLAACSNDAAAPRAPRARRAVEVLRPAAPPAANDAGAAPAAPPPPPAAEPFRVERATAVSPERAFAVSRGRLWRTVQGRWVELPVGGASIRDVAAAAGSAWVLARGREANAGRVIVLRSPADADALAVATEFLTPEAHDPRALAVASDHEFFIGGANPPLIRARLWAAVQMNTFALPQAVDGLVYMPDAMMALRYADGTVAMHRWGETMRVERPGYLFSFAGVRESLMMGRDAAVYRGHVWEVPALTDKLSPSADVAPAAAATLRDERVVIADARGRARVLTRRHWVEVEGPEAVSELAALVGARELARGLCVRVDRDGAVYELVGNRWERRAEPPPAAR